MGVGIPEGQRRLIEKVIDQGICVRCGACVGLCPYFHFFDGNVVVMDQCSADTWRCLQVCPRADYEAASLYSGSPDTGRNSGIGLFKKILIARASDEEIRNPAQYGGVVSALVIYSLEQGYIDSAVLTDTGSQLSPEGKIVRTRPEVLECAGSRYSASGSLSVLNTAIEAGRDKLGVVGLPCQMEAVARMKLMKPDGQDRSRRVGLKIGLFCTWAIDYRRLEAFLRQNGIKGTPKKYDIPPPPSEKFQVMTEEGRRDFPLSDIRPLVQKGCELCRDMTAEWADISIGTVEGREGWSTVVIRTDIGTELINAAIKDGWLEAGVLPDENLEHLSQAASNKRERGRKAAK